MKNYRNPDVAVLLKEAEKRPETVEWVTSKGIRVVLKSIPPYLVQLAAHSIPRPELPTYTVKIAGGGEETHFHDETSIAQSSDEEKARWVEYKSQLLRADQQATETVLDIILLEGIEVDEKEEQTLLKRLKLYGMNIPEDEDERTIMVRKAYLIGCEEDANTITSLVMTLTGVSIKDLNAVKKSFPDQVES